MLVTNQQLDKLVATGVEFQAQGMLDGPAINVDPPPEPEKESDNDDGDAIDGDVLTQVKLAWHSSA